MCLEYAPISARIRTDPLLLQKPLVLGPEETGEVRQTQVAAVRCCRRDSDWKRVFRSRFSEVVVLSVLRNLSFIPFTVQYSKALSLILLR